MSEQKDTSRHPDPRSPPAEHQRQAPPERTSRRGVKVVCYDCGGYYDGGEKLREHISQQLVRKSHADPPPAWLQTHGLAVCYDASHQPWVFPANRECRRCHLPKADAPINHRSLPTSVSTDPHLGCDRVDEAARPQTRQQAATAPHPRSTSRKPHVHTDLHDWLRDARSLTSITRAIQEAQSRPARRFLPRSVVGKRLAASAMLDVAHAAHEGYEAAQLLLAYAPRVLLSRHAPIVTQIAALINGESVMASPPPPAAARRDEAAIYHERVRAAIANSDLKSLNRLLADGVSSGPVARSQAMQVIREKFPYKAAGEIPDSPSPQQHDGAKRCRRTTSTPPLQHTDAEARWLENWERQCGGKPPSLTQRDLVRWARVKRDRAADMGGYSGRLILELHAIDPAVTSTLAKVWSMDLSQWANRHAAFATWRILRGSFIPQPTKPLPRPVATATVPRRAWGSMVVRSIRDAATSYCEKHGQYGLSRAGGQTAYVIAARVVHALGGDVAVDDKTNSFHELHRSAVYAGVDAYLRQLPLEQREPQGRPLVELIARTFAGPRPQLGPEPHATVDTGGSAAAASTTKTPRGAANRTSSSSHSPRGDGPSPTLDRSRYIFTIDGIDSITHHALCQGSSESSLLEALTYAQRGHRCSPGVLRCELHDDGYTAALPTASINAFERSPANDGSRIAESKNRVVGPRADHIRRAGYSASADAFVTIAGVPIGNIESGLTRWMDRYRRKLDRLREIAAIDAALAAAAASAIGGPAGLANHIMRCIPPDQVANSVWRQADREWIDMWCDILRLPAEDHANTTRVQVRDRVFLCHGPLALRQRSAEEHAQIRYAEGIADAATHLATMLDRAGRRLDETVWRALGVMTWRSGLDVVDSTRWTADVLRKAALKHANASAESLHSADVLRADRLRQVYPVSARSPTLDDENVSTPPNLFTAWMRVPHAGTARFPARDGLVALRRMFHLPLCGPATGINAPRSCRRCGAAAISSTGDLRSVPATGPRAVVDIYGEHALTCLYSCGQTQRRHNELASAICESIAEAGWRPRVASGQVFESHRGRPADVWVDNHPRHYGGQAIDCTIVSAIGRPRGSAAQLAEEQKIRKYETEVTRQPGLGFAPFAVDLFGNVGPAAWSQMQQWAHAQAAAPDSTRTTSEALQWITGNIARAFVAGCLRQIRAFEERQQSWLVDRDVPVQRAYLATATPRTTRCVHWVSARRRASNDSARSDAGDAGDNDASASSVTAIPRSALARRRRAERARRTTRWMARREPRGASGGEVRRTQPADGRTETGVAGDNHATAPSATAIPRSALARRRLRTVRRVGGERERRGAHSVSGSGPCATHRWSQPSDGGDAGDNDASAPSICAIPRSALTRRRRLERTQPVNPGREQRPTQGGSERTDAGTAASDSKTRPVRGVSGRSDTRGERERDEIPDSTETYSDSSTCSTSSTTSTPAEGGEKSPSSICQRR